MRHLPQTLVPKARAHVVSEIPSAGGTTGASRTVSEQNHKVLSKMGHLLGSTGFEMTAHRTGKGRETGQIPAAVLVVKLTFSSETQDFSFPVIKHSTVLQRQEMPIVDLYPWKEDSTMNYN